MASSSKDEVQVFSLDGGGGSGSRKVAGKKKKKKKKQNAALKPLEKQVRNFSKNMDKSTTEYFSRHEKSNQKKKNGWIRDFPKNSQKALSKMGMNTGLISIPGVKLPRLF